MTAASTTASTGPALSVVMPTRNQAAFIESAVESVMAQAVGPAADLELVVADGASDDGTPAVLARLAERHPGRLHWVSEPDGGPADAVNRAVARARAPVVGWLNSDDLYTPGAAARAMQAFADDASRVMVYGAGRHVDLDGGDLGLYPTLPPETPLQAWADGCPICQPTAFFRRDAFLALGGLDTSLRTAFDYDFWLRLFKAHGGRTPPAIVQVPEVQALSRLHEGGITLRLREQVALEGLQVVRRHLGPAPAHWLITHVGEALAGHPFQAERTDPRAHMAQLLLRARDWMAAGSPQTVQQLQAAHRGLHLATPDFGVDVHADGWTAPQFEMRVRQGDPSAVDGLVEGLVDGRTSAPSSAGSASAAPMPPGTRVYRRLRLWGRHAAPHGGPLRLRVQGVDTTDGTWEGGTSVPGPFSIVLPLRPLPSAHLSLQVQAEPAFVPAHGRAGSTDQRRLAFLLDAVELS